MTDVASAATVSLINAGTNQTISSSVTDDAGRFVLSFTRGFRPDPTATYYLEAVKGLNGNLPGSDALRVRTIARYQSGWLTLTNAALGGTVTIDPTTTALSIGAALRNGNPSPFAFASLIGSVQAASPSVYTPVPDLSQADCTAILALVDQALTANQDPVAGVTLNVGTNTWQPAQPQALFVTGYTPASGSVGTPVTASGTGFSTTPSNNVLRFNGTPATVTAATLTSLDTTVPPGATSGQTTLQVGSNVYMAPPFTVPVVISSVSPASASANTSVTIAGSGFDVTSLSNNAVTIGGTSATVTAATTTSLTFTVPTAAVTGLLTVSVNGSSTTADADFVVPVVVNSFAPTSGIAGTSIVLTGSGFSGTSASNSVKFNGVTATVTGASATSLTVTAPAATTGPITVTVAGQTGSSTTSFTFIPPGPNIQTIAGKPIPPAGTLATGWGIGSDGVAVDSSGNLYVADSHVAIVWKVATNGVCSAYAGTGIAGFSGDGGAAVSSQLNNPVDVALDGAGNLYILDRYGYRIRKVTAGGIISTVAGSGTTGFSGDGGAATSAQFAYSDGFAVDSAGNIFIADRGNHRIRKVNTSGIMSTVAGTGTPGFLGDGGAATSAQINNPEDVAVDTAGNLYIADYSNCCIRKVNTSGNISTIAGIGGSPGSSSDGGAATSALLNGPTAITVDGTGNLFFMDIGSNRIRRVSAGIISSVAGNGTGGYSGDGGAATSAQILGSYGTAVDSAGNLYIADKNNYRVRMVPKSSGTCFGQSMTANYIYTVAGNGGFYAGDGGAATSAQLSGVRGVAVDGTGNVYLADHGNNRVRKVTAGGIISTIAGTGIAGYSGDGGAAATAKLNGPYGVTVDAAGNLYIAEQSSCRVRMVPKTSGTYFGQGMTTNNIYTIAGNGTNSFSGDGGAATSAQLYLPGSVAVDGAGNFYISDTANHRIRKVNTSGIISTVAGAGTAGSTGDGGAATSALLNWPDFVAVDGAGNLYIADTSNHRIRMVPKTTGNYFGQSMTANYIYTVAGTGAGGFSGDGGAATGAQINTPRGLALDAAGNLYIPDLSNHRIRKVNTNGIISTVAGTGAYGFSGDGGAATSAQFYGPISIAVDGAGSLYISDFWNYCIRKVQ